MKTLYNMYSRLCISSWLIHCSVPSERRDDADRISKGGNAWQTSTHALHTTATKIHPSLVIFQSLYYCQEYTLKCGVLA